DGIRNDALEDIRRSSVNTFGEQTGKHRGVGRVGVALPASSESQGDVPTALQVRGPLPDDLQDTLVLGWIVDGGKRPCAGRDAQITKQAIGAKAGEPYAIQSGKTGAPERQQVDLRTGGIARQVVERLLPIRVKIRWYLIHHSLTSRPTGGAQRSGQRWRYAWRVRHH